MQFPVAIPLLLSIFLGSVGSVLNFSEKTGATSSNTQDETVAPRRVYFFLGDLNAVELAVGALLKSLQRCSS
jgi:hypothetical protein